MVSHTSIGSGRAPGMRFALIADEVRVAIDSDADIISSRQKGRGLASQCGFPSTYLAVVGAARRVTARWGGGRRAAGEGRARGGEAGGAARAAGSWMWRRGQERCSKLVRRCQRCLAGARGVVRSVRVFGPLAGICRWVAVG